MPLSLKKAVARFRLSGSKLRAVSEHTLDYDRRICRRCNHAVDNEHHMLFECTHAGLQQLRDQHRELFLGVDSVKQFMMAAYNHDTVVSLATCIRSMMHAIEV